MTSLYDIFIEWSRDNDLLSEHEAARRLESNVDESREVKKSMSVSLSMRTKSIAQNKEWQRRVT